MRRGVVGDPRDERGESVLWLFVKCGVDAAGAACRRSICRLLTVAIVRLIVFLCFNERLLLECEAVVSLSFYLLYDNNIY